MKVVLIRGGSGVGKTSIIQQLHQPVLKYRFVFYYTKLCLEFYLVIFKFSDRQLFDVI